MKFNLLSITKTAFWVLISLIILSVPLIFYLEYKEVIRPPNNINNFSEIIYSNGLSFLFSIIGFLVAVIIFLIQHISSKYHAEELEKLPIFLKYFVITLIILLTYIIFNFVSLYLKLEFPYELMSFIFSISLVFLILITIIFVYYNTKVSTVLGMISEDIIKFIGKKKKFKKIPIFNDIAYSEDFIKDLNKKVSIFIKNSKGAIKNDQDVIFRNSLENIRKICHEYLEQSKHIQATEDKFLSELNDQFNFIITECLNSSNQKILEDVAKTIGAISLNIIEYRKGIGDVNNFALNWLGTLKELFIKSYNKDRTIVCHICLEEINKVILLTLDKGYYRSYNSYNMFIDDISEILSKINQYWSAILLQKALLMYQHQFLKFLELLKNNKIIFSDFFIKQYFDKIAETINEAKKVHKPFGNNAVIFASLYGVDSFAQNIAKVGLNDIKDNKIKRGLVVYLKEFINFNNKIINTNSDKNDNRVYDSFSESLFLLIKYVDIEEDDKKALIKNLSYNLLEYIKKRYLNASKEYDNKLYELKDVTIDYFALLIYLNHEKVDIINEITQNLLDIYNQIKKEPKNENQQNVLRLLYKELKLYSCWIDIFSNLKDINKPIIKVLIGNFYEPTFPSRISIPSLFERYDYPESNISRLSGLWYPHPSYMWGSMFQDEISNKLNWDKGKLYIKFHEMLKSAQNRRKKK